MDVELRRAVRQLLPDRPRSLGAAAQFDSITVPNSTCFSPDDRTLYFADSPRHAIWAFDFDIDAGMIGNRRVFADLTGRKGLPDGSCIDAQGLSLERRIRRPPVDPLRAGRPGRPHHRAAGDQPDLLLLRRRRSRHPLCHQRERNAWPEPAPIEGALLALDVGVRGLPEAAFGG